MGEHLGLHPDFFVKSEFLTFAGRLGINLFFALILVFAIYARRRGKTQYVFTYVMFNLITFTLCFMLRGGGLSLEFALGLFAVFGILRYRTEAIGIHELTYLFIVIGIAIVNAMASVSTPLSVVLLINGIILFSAHQLEFIPGLQSHSSININYDDMELLRSQDTAAVCADLAERTGFKVQHYQVTDIDLLKQTARVTLYY